MKIGELIENNVCDMEERQDNRALITGVPTGYSRLDQLTAGFQSSNLITLCGASGSGKRALAYNFARNAAIEGGMKVTILNLSFKSEEASLMFLSSEARIDSSRIRSGFLSPDDWLRLTDAAVTLTDAEIDIVGRFEQFSEDEVFECDLLVIDSFQRLPADILAPNISQEQISYKIANRYKDIAISRDIPIIIVSSLNDWRIDQRSDKRPRLSDFKYGYSALPDISDVVISIYRDEMYNHDENNQNRGTAEVIILKQRTGPTGRAILTYLNSFCRFENLANEPE